MTALLLYIARSGLYLGVFYAFYLLVMRRTTFFRLNRFVLLAGSVACALLPLLRVQTAPETAITGLASLPAVTEAVQATGLEAGIAWGAVLWPLYLAGALSVLGYILLSTARIHSLARKGQRTRIDGFETILLRDGHPSFTFGKTIFISPADLQEHPAIFLHETRHVIHRHDLDLDLFLVFQTLWWWNPLVWATRKELSLLHEYEADEGVLQQGIDATQYQLLLVRKAVGEQRFSLSCGFRHVPFKNRIAMMTKPSSRGWMRLSYLALIPLLAVLAYACNPTKNKKTADPAEGTVQETAAEAVPYQLVEQKPSFQDGDANTFAKWVNEHLTYPEAAKDVCAQGRVTLQFTVETDGSITNAKVLRGVHPTLDEEALRVVSGCPERWTPGFQNGEPVPVIVTFPVIFKLK